jgi:hypothetical protein
LRDVECLSEVDCIEILSVFGLDGSAKAAIGIAGQIAQITSVNIESIADYSA